MSRKLALTSNGPLSGKSTLAAHLRDKYGFVVASHSLSVVRSFAELKGVSVDFVYEHKEQFRQDLQQHGYDVGFNDPERAEYWILRTLSDWYKTWPEKDVVFDPIRGEGQAETIRGMGFTLVQIWISDAERLRRAEAIGRDYGKIAASMNAHPELERGIKHPDVRLNGELSTEVLGRILMHRGEDSNNLRIFGSRIR